MANYKSESCSFNPYKHRSHFVRHLITTVILVIITFLAGLYLAGTGVFSPFGQEGVESSNLLYQGGEIDDSVKKGSYETGYNEALDFARQRLSENGEFEPPSFLRATVKSASGQNVVVEFNADILDPFAEGMVTRAIIIDTETKLYERVDKDEEQLNKEYAEYEKIREEFEVVYATNPDSEGLEEPREPQEYEEKVLAVSDLLPGDRVRIRGKVVEIEVDKEGEELPRISPFASDTVEATEIRLYSRPEQKEELPEEPVEDPIEEPVVDPVEEPTAE